MVDKKRIDSGFLIFSITIEQSIIAANAIINKNAFQWDVYCPLVDRIPACTTQGRCLPGRGVSAQGRGSAQWGVSGQEGCLPGGKGICPGGVCLPRGVCLLGVSARGRGNVCPGVVCIPEYNGPD